MRHKLNWLHKIPPHTLSWAQKDVFTQLAFLSCAKSIRENMFSSYMMTFVLFKIWQIITRRRPVFLMFLGLVRNVLIVSLWWGYVFNFIFEIWQAKEQRQVLALIYRSVSQRCQINPINPLENNTNIWKIVVQEAVWLVLYVTDVRWFYILSVLWLTCECRASWIGCNFKIKACGKDDKRNLPWSLQHFFLKLLWWSASKLLYLLRE